MIPLLRSLNDPAWDWSMLCDHIVIITPYWARRYIIKNEYHLRWYH